MTGKLLVFEGIDGAGTTSQADRYAEHLRARRRRVHVTRQPSGGPIGALLRQALQGRMLLRDGYQAETMALLFAADRLDHLAREIEPQLRQGAVVLCDRYDLSSLAYQAATAGAGRDEREIEAWLRACNRFARRPDATVVIEVSPAIAEQRRKSRAGAPELYEVSELQARLAERYRRAEELVPGDRVIRIDGDADIDAVFAAVCAALDPIVGA